LVVFESHNASVDKEAKWFDVERELWCLRRFFKRKLMQLKTSKQ